MDIKSIEDIKKVVGQMHDSEFEGIDLSFDSDNNIFHLKSYCPKDRNKTFNLEVYNVEKYDPINLDKINEGKALGGVFNDILVGDNGLKLTLLSQDLKIVLNVNKLEGKFKVIEK